MGNAYCLSVVNGGTLGRAGQLGDTSTAASVTNGGGAYLSLVVTYHSV